MRVVTEGFTAQVAAASDSLPMVLVFVAGKSCGLADATRTLTTGREEFIPSRHKSWGGSHHGKQAQ
jgi:hypothetical protein